MTRRIGIGCLLNIQYWTKELETDGVFQQGAKKQQDKIGATGHQRTVSKENPEIQQKITESKEY